jgi:Xaa-Pro aminopeptidase
MATDRRHVHYPGVDGKALVNKPRAYEVMERYGVDGLIALNPINVYYLANTMPLATRFRSTYPAFATFPRDPSQPTFLVTMPGQAMDFANPEREVPELMTYTGAVNWKDYINASAEQLEIEPLTGARTGWEASHPEGWAVSPEGPFNDRERRWIAAQRKSNDSGAATIAWALVKALRASGLGKARVAVDDMRIDYLLKQIGIRDIECIPGENLFRRIRVVKTPPELALLRVAGANNAHATMKSIRQIQRGMTSEEIEDLFLIECAALGSERVSFLPGMAIGRFPDGEVVEGKPFIVDAVSHFREYHGDCGRTIVVGEPSVDVRARVKAHRAGYDAVYSTLRAGLRLSDIRRIATDAMVKAGMPAKTIIVNPHSVGLEHGDNPARDDLPFEMLEDIVLEEDMVITVDLASLEIGWGFIHHEDLVRITKSGFEAIPSIEEPLTIV